MRESRNLPRCHLSRYILYAGDRIGMRFGKEAASGQLAWRHGPEQDHLLITSPLGQGAVMNLVTQSGTNKIRGTSLFSWQRKDWGANNNPGGTSSASAIVTRPRSLEPAGTGAR